MERYETEIMQGAGELGKSRSQKKRESTALQKMGEALTALAPSVLNEIGVPADLAAAIAELHGMKKHEARRRQTQLIGRLMRELDEAAQERIALGLERLDKKHQSESGDLHRLEELREALIDEHSREAAFAAVLGEFPSAEPKKLRHLVTTAAAERAGGKGVKTYRELFRYLKSLNSNSGQSAE